MEAFIFNFIFGSYYEKTYYYTYLFFCFNISLSRLHEVISQEYEPSETILFMPKIIPRSQFSESEDSGPQNHFINLKLTGSMDY